LAVSPGAPQPTPPNQDETQKAWTALRIAAGVRCRRHDLRHTITKLAESDASDSTIMAIAGHLSRAMLERYSHVRMGAKRRAVEALTIKPKRDGQRNGHSKAETAGESKKLGFQAIVFMVGATGLEPVTSCV